MPASNLQGLGAALEPDFLEADHRPSVSKETTTIGPDGCKMLQCEGGVDRAYGGGSES